MSYINIHVVEQDSLEHVIGDGQEPAGSLTDGEEIAACVEILSLLEDLKQGEALVVWKDIF